MKSAVFEKHEAISYGFSFCFSLNKCETHLFSFFTLLISLECVEIVEMDTLSCAHSSSNVVCGFHSTKVFSLLLSTEGFRPLPSLS